MLTQGQSVALTHHNAVVGVILAEELLHHGKCLGRGNHRGLGIAVQENINACGMVRLHVMDHQEIGLPALQNGFQIAQPFFDEVLIDGVHDGNLFVQDHIGIVSHTARDDVLALEQVHLVVIDANIADIFGNSHIFLSL